MYHMPVITTLPINALLLAALPENSNFGSQFKFYCKTPNFDYRPHWWSNHSTRNIITIDDDNTVETLWTTRHCILPYSEFYCGVLVCCFDQKFFYFRAYTTGTKQREKRTEESYCTWSDQRDTTVNITFHTPINNEIAYSDQQALKTLKQSVWTIR